MRSDVMQSTAYEVLRPSSKRLLAFVEREIERQGGGNVRLYNDELEMIGSRRIVLPSLSELNALGFLRVTRYQKQHVIGLSDGWRAVSKRDARVLSASARIRPMPVLGQQPASASTGAILNPP
jgi:hypothetical protein